MELSENIKKTTNSIQTQIEHDRFCEALRNALNAYGCILRQMPQNKDARIVGVSGTAAEGFGKRVRENLQRPNDKFIDEFGRFHLFIRQIFTFTVQTSTIATTPLAPQTSEPDPDYLVKKQFKVVAALITFPFASSEAFSIQYFYRGINKRDLHHTTETFLFTNPEQLCNIFNSSDQLFNPDIITPNTDANEPSIKQVLIMDIPQEDVDGVLTLSNTVNRDFDFNHIKYAHFEMIRLGNDISREFRRDERSRMQLHALAMHNLGRCHVAPNNTASLRQDVADFLRTIFFYNADCLYDNARKHPCSMSQLCKQVMESYQTFSSEHCNIDLKFEEVFESEENNTPLPNVIINEKGFILVLHELIFNAIKYSNFEASNRGSIIIRHTCKVIKNEGLDVIKCIIEIINQGHPFQQNLIAIPFDRLREKFYTDEQKTKAFIKNKKQQMKLHDAEFTKLFNSKHQGLQCVAEWLNSAEWDVYCAYSSSESTCMVITNDENRYNQDYAKHHHKQ